MFVIFRSVFMLLANACGVKRHNVLFIVHHRGALRITEMKDAALKE
jgi:hypothetical protein